MCQSGLRTAIRSFGTTPTQAYQVGEFYTPDAEGGLMYNDPRLGLRWPLPVSIISEKDQRFRLIGEIECELKRKMTLVRTEQLTSRRMSPGTNMPLLDQRETT